MKILVLGCNGQLGYDMVQTVNAEKNISAIGIDFPDIDISNRELTEKIILYHKPEVIVNCAAYTAVDLCETNIDLAYSVNAKGVENIALCAKMVDATVVHISTDYVFDGLKNEAYGEIDSPNPQTVYGKSKLEGELKLSHYLEKHYIFRIAWLYGMHGKNFVKTIRKLAIKNFECNQPLKIVNDQYGSPTFTLDVCHQILAIVFTKCFGLYHCTNEGKCTWFDFARFIVSQYDIPVELIPCASHEFPSLAQRPRNSVLENYRLKSMNMNRMPDWKDSFSTYVKMSLKEMDQNGQSK